MSDTNAKTETPLERALAFMESLTVDPLLLGFDDVEADVDDIREHAAMELASIRKAIDAAQDPVADVYDEIMQLVATEAMRICRSDQNNDGLGPGACSAAVISTVIFSWADNFGPHYESVIDGAADSAKETLRQKRAAEDLLPPAPHDLATGEIG